MMLRLEAIEQRERREWMRTSHQLALNYNIHRGKAEARSWEDFFPFHPDGAPARPPDLTNGVPPIFEAMRNAMNHGK